MFVSNCVFDFLQISVEKVGGYEHCGTNVTMWSNHAGDPNYNLLNECCLAMNSRELILAERVEGCYPD